MSIDNLYTSHILADRLQRARREASYRARTADTAHRPRKDFALWVRLRRAFRRLA